MVQKSYEASESVVSNSNFNPRTSHLRTKVRAANQNQRTPGHQKIPCYCYMPTTHTEVLLTSFIE